MPSHKAAKRPPHAHHGAGRGASRGVSKSAVTKSGRGRGRGAAPGRALAAATAAVTAAARGHGGASSQAGSSSLAFAELAYDPFAAELVALICELVEARGVRKAGGGSYVAKGRHGASSATALDAPEYLSDHPQSAVAFLEAHAGSIMPGLSPRSLGATPKPSPRGMGGSRLPPIS